MDINLTLVEARRPSDGRFIHLVPDPNGDYFIHTVPTLLIDGEDSIYAHRLGPGDEMFLKPGVERYRALEPARIERPLVAR